MTTLSPAQLEAVHRRAQLDATLQIKHGWQHSSNPYPQLGQPLVKLHGLRMLNPEIFTRLPFSSADSTNIGRNIGIDQAWKGNYMPPTKDMRAAVMRSRIESQNAPATWSFSIPEYQPEDQGSLI